MNELFIYALFGEIIGFSTVLEGRFVVVKSGTDINESNHADIVRDSLDGLTDAQKYPVAILFPPLEIIPSYTKGWSTFRMVMYFLTKAGRTGIGELENMDRDALISNHRMIHDWKDMRECAGDFRMVFNKITRNRSLVNSIRENLANADSVERVTWAGNDVLNGVRLSFDVDLFMPCAPSDYPSDIESRITIPPLNPHPIHKH